MRLRLDARQVGINVEVPIIAANGIQPLVHHNGGMQRIACHQRRVSVQQLACSIEDLRSDRKNGGKDRNASADGTDSCFMSRGVLTGSDMAASADTASTRASVLTNP